MSTFASKIILCLCMASTLSAQLPDSTAHQQMLTLSRRITKTALTDTMGYSWLRDLCSRGHRLPGSEQAAQAIDWAEALCMQAGADTVWRLPCPVPHWIRGEVETAVVPSTGLSLSVAALGYSSGTADQGLNAPVIEIKSWEELEARADECNGAIVFYNRPMDPGMIQTFAAYGKAVDQRVHGASRAAAHGAVAVLVRSVTTRYDDVPHVGTLSYNPEQPRIPAAALGLISADRLSQALRVNPALKLTLTLSCRNLPETKSANLMAQITGTEKPNEIIVLGGHYDSWDKGVGAHDDGGGCLQCLEVLSLYKRLGIRPKRSIRIVFFMNEEMGLSGAREYGKWEAESREKHLAAVEVDRGVTTPRGYYTVSKPPVLEKMRSWLPYLNEACIEWLMPGGAGGDVAQIKGTAAQLGLVPDIQRYFDWHHSENDQFDQVHPREMEMGSAALAILAYLISEQGL